MHFVFFFSLSLGTIRVFFFVFFSLTLTSSISYSVDFLNDLHSPVCTWESSDRGQTLFTSIITLPQGRSGRAEFVSATITTHHHTNQETTTKYPSASQCYKDTDMHTGTHMRNHKAFNLLWHKLNLLFNWFKYNKVIYLDILVCVWVKAFCKLFEAASVQWKKYSNAQMTSEVNITPFNYQHHSVMNVSEMIYKTLNCNLVCDVYKKMINFIYYIYSVCLLLITVIIPQP